MPRRLSRPGGGPLASDLASPANVLVSESRRTDVRHHPATTATTAPAPAAATPAAAAPAPAPAGRRRAELRGSSSATIWQVRGRRGDQLRLEGPDEVPRAS